MRDGEVDPEDEARCEELVAEVTDPAVRRAPYKMLCSCGTAGAEMQHPTCWLKGFAR